MSDLHSSLFYAHLCGSEGRQVYSSQVAVIMAIFAIMVSQTWSRMNVYALCFDEVDVGIHHAISAMNTDTLTYFL